MFGENYPIMKIITPIITALCAFFLPIQGLLLAVGFAILLDTFTGIFKAVKLNGWKSLRSRRASDLVGKVILYNTVTLVMYIIDKNLLSEFMQHWFSIPFLCTKIIAVILVIIEFKSIKENFDEAFKTDTWQLLRKLLARGKEIKNDINEITN